MSCLSLHLLGVFQLSLDGHPVTKFGSNKVKALLAYLTMEANRPKRRDMLAGMLWPDIPQQTSQENLRFALSDLRKRIITPQSSSAFISADHDSIQFILSNDVWIDVAAFEQQLIQATETQSQLINHEQAIPCLEAASTLYQGEFLEDFTLGENTPFDDWALFQRTRLRQKNLWVLMRLADICEKQADYAQAQIYSMRQIEIEPGCEEAHQQLMRALALSGQRSAALKQYKICQHLLRKDLDVEPSDETKKLYEAIRDGQLDSGNKTLSEPPVLLTSSLPTPSSNGRPLNEANEVQFVGRAKELAQLGNFYNRALSGEGQVVFVTGDPGEGKTLLVRQFTDDAMRTQPDLIVVQGAGNAFTGVGDPYLPFLEILQMLTGDVQSRLAAGSISYQHVARLLALLPETVQAIVNVAPDLINRFISGATLLERVLALQKKEGNKGNPTWLTQLAELVKQKSIELSAPGVRHREDILDQFTQVLHLLANKHSLILVLDDFQWADTDSINLLFHLGRRLAGHRILILCAFRPGDVTVGRNGERHPLESVVNEFRRVWHELDINLTQSTLMEGRQFIDFLLDSQPNDFDAKFRESLFRHTLGHPLFTVELLRGMRERGDLQVDESGKWHEGPVMNWENMPPRIEAVIAEQIGRLPMSEQNLLAAASVEGEEFTAEVVASLQSMKVDDVVHCLSGGLARQQHLVTATHYQKTGSRSISRYRFRHALFQKYLYRHLDEIERIQYHEKTALALETLYSEQCDDVAIQLAWHFQVAGMKPQAVDYLIKAGERAAVLMADQQAVDHFYKGLDLLRTLPESPGRDAQELTLSLALGARLGTLHTHGNQEINRLYTRARELSLKIGNPVEFFTTLLGLASYHCTMAEYQQGLEMIEQLFLIAQQTGETFLKVMAHWGKAFPLMCMGEYRQSRDYLALPMAFPLPPQQRQVLTLIGIDMGVSSLTWLTCDLFILGYPDQAEQCSHQAIALAREIGHSNVLSQALSVGGVVFSHLSRDFQMGKLYAEELDHLNDAVVSYLLVSKAHLGHYWVMVGQYEKGFDLIKTSMTHLWNLGYMRVNWTHLQSLLVDAYLKTGQIAAGLDILSDAFEWAEKIKEGIALAELYRLKGELLQACQKTLEAEASFHQAIDVARRQEAKSWELRATLSLYNLYLQQGREAEIHQQLADIYSWFTEGFDTPDLKEARLLLNLPNNYTE